MPVSRTLGGPGEYRLVNIFWVPSEARWQSKIFPNAAFGYWKVTVERPLRLKVDLGDERRRAFRPACMEGDEEPIANIADRIAETLGSGPHGDFNEFLSAVERDADAHRVKLTARRKKLLQTVLAERDEGAREVIARVHKPAKTEPDPLRGLFPATVNGKESVVEYEPDGRRTGC
jgi:type I restriction enzyme M protein